MEVAVDGEEGSTIEIGVRHAGDAEFGSEGITSSADATCTDGVSSDEDSTATITDGHVVFYTCGASAFLLKAGGAGALRFWVRGNKGITTSGAAVTKWDDVGK